MTTFPASGYISNDARTEGDVKTALENTIQSAKEMLGGTVESTLAIASGSITPTGGCHAVDTEGSTATDDLTNVVQTNQPDGRLLLLRPANAARNVVLKHAAGGAGQLTLSTGADRTLPAVSEWVLLKRSGTVWEEIQTNTNGVPTGSVTAWLRSGTVPTGWLLCNGQAVGRTQFGALFAVLGTTYGAGNGTTTFNLPNLSGRMLVCFDSTSDFPSVGATAGQRAVTPAFVGAALAPTSFSLAAVSVGNPGNALGVSNFGNALFAPLPGTTFANGTVGTFTGSQSPGTPTGSITAVPTLPPYFCVQYIVKT